MSITMKFNCINPLSYLAVAAMELSYPGEEILVKESANPDPDSLLVFIHLDMEGTEPEDWQPKTVASIVHSSIPSILLHMQAALPCQINLWMVRNAQTRMEQFLSNTHPSGKYLLAAADAYVRIGELGCLNGRMRKAGILYELKEIIYGILNMAVLELLEPSERGPCIEPKKDMRFGVALDLLLDGTVDSIARKTWDNHQAVSIFSGTGGGELLVTKAVVDNVWLSWTPSRDDIFATDWICSQSS